VVGPTENEAALPRGVGKLGEVFVKASEQRRGHSTGSILHLAQRLNPVQLLQLGMKL